MNSSLMPIEQGHGNMLIRPIEPVGQLINYEPETPWLRPTKKGEKSCGRANRDIKKGELIVIHITPSGCWICDDIDFKEHNKDVR